MDMFICCNVRKQTNSNPDMSEMVSCLPRLVCCKRAADRQKQTNIARVRGKHEHVDA